MNFNQFNFEQGLWLWGLLLIPVLWTIFALQKSRRHNNSGLERFADKHLLPYLVKTSGVKASKDKKRLALWSLIWMLGIFSMAGPRWDFQEIKSFKTSKNLVVLLDLSQSMDATDVKPSRLIRAREKIQDLLESSPGVNIGLVAFAADAHLITPITEDKAAIRYVLSSLRTDLVAVPGSRLQPALKMAEQMLSAVPGKEKAILVMSDGDFEDSGIDRSLENLAANGIEVSTLGLGTLEGAPVPTLNGGFFNDESGRPLISKLQQTELSHISDLGKGISLGAADAVEGRSLFAFHTSNDPTQATDQVIKDWEPRFYIFLTPLLLLMLSLFRRTQPAPAPAARKKWKTSLAAAALFILPHQSRAGESLAPAKNSTISFDSLFKNEAVRGKEAFEAHDYETAIKTFKDPYRRGVAEYKAGQFAQAEKSFKESRRETVSLDAKYNLGNALAEQGKYEDAIESYEEVLKAAPNHQPAKENLKIVQNLLKKQNQAQNQDQNKNEDKKQDQNKDQQQSQAKNQSDQGKGSDQKPGGDKGSDKNQDQKQAGNQKDQQNSAKPRQDQNAGQEKQGDQKTQANQDKASAEEEAKRQQEQKSQQAKTADRQETPSPDNEYRPDQQKIAKTPQDVDADQWLNRIASDPHRFLKNQFFIESSRLQTQRGERIW